MCGIAGFVRPDADRHRGRLDAMVEALAHRGPDGAGVHIDGPCALGHRRLSIIDHENGSQPMRSPRDPGLAISFNGEIYGYRELKRSLPDYPFRTRSDTEVVLALYETHGLDFLGRLPGMFAFAIWDARRQRLVCARDRFGEKPFYYTLGEDGEFAFGSGLAALRAGGRWDREIDSLSLAHYLRRLYVPPDRTIYEDVHTLPPGHLLVYQEGRVDVTAYWQLPDPSGADLPLADAVEEFTARFDSAVETQLVADVPVAAFLSGGADSTSVVASAASRVPDLATLAYGFGDGPSELPFAAEVARRFGTRHVEIVDGDSNLEEVFLASQRWFDEPFADSSSVPYFVLARRARQHAKVVLTGDGGDELMAGYAQWYRPLRSVGRHGPSDAAVRRVLAAARSACRRMALRFPDRLTRQLEGLDLAATTGSVAEAHFSQVAFFGDDDLRRLGLTPPPWPEFWRTHDKTHGLDDALRMDLSSYLPGDILVKADRMSMAHGLELRAPFLDRDLAEFCIGLPHRLKLDGRRDKILLREAFARTWPARVRNRPKQGFGAPVHAWLRRPRFDELVRDHLDDPRSPLFDLVDFAGSRPYVAGRGYACWILLVLATWLEAQARGGAR